MHLITMLLICTLLFPWSNTVEAQWLYQVINTETNHVTNLSSWPTKLDSNEHLVAIPDRRNIKRLVDEDVDDDNSWMSIYRQPLNELAKNVNRNTHRTTTP